jgi:hypothetical protein
MKSAGLLEIFFRIGTTLRKHLSGQALIAKDLIKLTRPPRCEDATTWRIDESSPTIAPRPVMRRPGLHGMCVGQGSSTRAEHYTEMVVDP